MTGNILIELGSFFQGNALTIYQSPDSLLKNGCRRLLAHQRRGQGQTVKLRPFEIGNLQRENRLFPVKRREDQIHTRRTG